MGRRDGMASKGHYRERENDALREGRRGKGEEEWDGQPMTPLEKRRGQGGGMGWKGINPHMG